MADSKKSIVKSATSMVNIVVAGSAAIGAVALHSWAIAAVGGATFFALTAWDLVAGDDRKKRRDSVPGAPPLATSDDVSDAQTKAALQTIEKARAEIDRVLEETPADVQASLSMVGVSVNELEERARKLGARGEDLARYLAGTSFAQVEKDVEALTQRARMTEDKEARAQYEGARAARAEHLATLKDLVRAKERIDASMLSIAATLDGLPPKIVRMRAMDAQAMDQLGGDVKDELDRMNGEIQSFEETLAHLGEKVR